MPAPPRSTDLPQAVIAKSRESVLGSSTPMQFPSELGRYFTIVKFVRYQRNNPKTPSIKVDQADVVLPLPANLREYYSMAYGDVELDKLGGMVDTVDRIVDQYLSGNGSVNWNGVIEDAGRASVGLAEALARKTLGAVSNDVGAIIDRVQGNVVNPHITTVFRGVNLREHHLQWRLNARSAAESRSIRSIVNYVRERMHPTKKTDFLLNFPDEVYVKFYADDKPFLFPIFKAVVTGIDCPQSSEGTNAFFKETDEPVVFDVSLTLKEVEAVTRETFSELDSEDLGLGEVQTDEAGTGVAP